MKRWFTHITFLLLLLTFSASLPVLAQDAGMSDVELVDEAETLGSEKVPFIPGEDLRYIPKAHDASDAKDSIDLQIHDFPMQQAAMKSPEKPNEKQPAAKPKDDSILTFNFLYYIIQKYKLQDIID